jgi:hypothetical protein
MFELTENQETQPHGAMEQGALGQSQTSSLWKHRKQYAKHIVEGH